MGAVDSVLRIIIAPVVVVSIIITSWLAVKIMDPYTAGLEPPAASLGWPAYSTIYEFMSLAFIALVFVILIWLWWAPIRDDKRQEMQPRGPF